MESDRLTRIVVGKKGSGKTYYCVMKAVEALMAGDVLVTNIKLHWERVVAYAKKQGVTLHPGNYRFVDTEEIVARPLCILDALAAKSTLVLDEAHLMFDSREYAKTKQTAGGFQAFLTQGRKLEVDTYLITQAAANLDSRMCRQGTYFLDVSNFRHMPLLGALLPLPISLVRTKDGKGNVLLRDWWWRPGWVKGLYDTRQKFLGIALLGESAAVVKGARRRRMPYSLGVALVGALLILFSRVHAWTASAKVDAPAAAAPAPAAAEVPAQAPVTEIDRVGFEYGLPLMRRASRDKLVLVDGTELVRGSPFGLGSVRFWQQTAPGVVTVFTDSQQLPQIRIYERKPLLYRPGVSPDRGAAVGADVVGGGVSVPAASLDSGRLTAPASPAYSPPLPFIPQSSSGPAMDWAGSTRIPNSRENWSSGRLRYDN